MTIFIALAISRISFRPSRPHLLASAGERRPTSPAARRAVCWTTFHPSLIALWKQCRRRHDLRRGRVLSGDSEVGCERRRRLVLGILGTRVDLRLVVLHWIIALVPACSTYVEFGFVVGLHRIPPPLAIRWFLVSIWDSGPGSAGCCLSCVPHQVGSWVHPLSDLIVGTTRHARDRLLHSRARQSRCR